MRKFTLLLHILCLVGLKSFAQEAQHITGVILNNENQALAGAMITCFSLPDSTVTSYAVSDEKGHFQINIPVNKVNKYNLEVTYIGYEKQYARVASGEMKICMKEATNYLGEVVVKAKSTLEKKAGKFVYSPLASDFNKGLDSYEILKYIPLLNVQGDAIKMLGEKGVTIYINGRLPAMSQNAVIEMLRSTSADKIKKIEIITAPTSAYKASMLGGVVNIVMASPDDGLTGRIYAGLDYRNERLSPSGTLSLGYAKSKFRSSAMLWVNTNNLLNETATDYDYKVTGVTIKNYSLDKSSSLYGGGNVNLEYDINKKNNIGASFNLIASNYWSDGTVDSEYKINGNQDYFLRSVSSSITPQIKPSIGTTIYYNLKTDTLGSNFDISVSYNDSYSNTKSTMEYLKAFPGRDYERYEMFTQNPLTEINSYELKATYSHDFKDESMLQAGYEGNATHIYNDFQRQNWDGEQYVNDATLNNLFIYDEFVNALFVSYDREWTNVFSTTIGLRGEHTYIKGEQRSQNEQFERNYFNLFPKLSLNFNFAEGNHNLSLDLGKSIYRPFYTNLNPFKIWTSPNTYTAGNKNLESVLAYNADLIYTLKNDYTFGVSYYYDSNAISDYIGPGEEENTTMTSTYNYGYEQSLSFSAEVRKNFFNGIWQSKLSLNAYASMANGNINNEDISFKSLDGSINWTNVIRLSKKHQWDMTLCYYYSTPSKAVSRIWSQRNYLWLDIMKQFKFGGILKLSAYNLLNDRMTTKYDSDAYYYRISPLTSAMTFSISYTQRFGNSKVRGAKNAISSRMNNRKK